VDRFRNLVKALAAVVVEGCFHLDESGVELMAMDPSHVSMVDFRLPAEFFDAYNCKEETMLSIRVEEFLRFLDRIRKEEEVAIKLEEDKAQLHIHSTSRGHTRRFVIPILEPLEEAIPQPKVFYKSSARILIGSLRRALRDASLVSEQVELHVSGAEVKMSAVGNMGSTDSVWSQEAEDLLEVTAEEASKGRYYLSYLRDMVNAAASSCEVATLELSTEMPLKINFELPQGRLIYYLAPMIGV